MSLLDSILDVCWLLLYLNAAMATDASLREAEKDRCNKTVDIYQAVSTPPVNEKNRGRPLHCTYRIRVRPAREDWIVFVRFTRLRIGIPAEDRRKCIGGHLQIVDGYRDSNETNRNSPGFYCGEIDSPKFFVSETPYVKIVFHANNYGHDTYLQFDANVEQQSEVHARYGQYAQLYPHRRGSPIPGTYCQRKYHDCSPGRCFVQSPGFPGIYPRNLHCKYHLRVSQSLVGLDLTTFDVDGLRCDNLLMCFPRPVTRNQDECPYDYVRVYDGASEDNSLIVTLCGRGRLKSNIIASGPEMLVVFVSSPAGPLLNTGFHFKADSIYGATESQPLQLKHKNCTIERHLGENQQHVFSNLRSWYPVNTSCSYRFLVAEDEIIRVEFVSFRVERVTLCEESLKLYDSYDADPAKIISKICDINRPRTDPPRSLYETTSPSMFIEFFSKTGSLDGSSIGYGFEVKAINIGSRGSSSTHSTCSRTYLSENGLSGQFGITAHDINITTHSQPLWCNYTFHAHSLPHGRVNITIASGFQTLTENCDQCQEELIVIQFIQDNKIPICLCSLGRKKVYSIASLGPILHMNVKTEPVSEGRNFSPKDRQLAEVDYNFYSETRCGPEDLELDLQGVLVFPPLGMDKRCSSGCTRQLWCNWNIPVFHRMDVAFRLDYYNSPGNCTTDTLTIDHLQYCPKNGVRDREFLVRKEEVTETGISIQVRTKEAMMTNFSLWWTQLKVLPPPSGTESLLSLEKDCEFLCTFSRTCLTKELVCNGVPNCPNFNTDYQLTIRRDDEEFSLCETQDDRFQFYWWIIGLGLGICACVTLCLIFSLCRRCHAGRERF